MVKVRPARFRLRIDRAQSSVDWLCAGKVVIANSLAECTRSTMHHKPEPILFIGLQFEKMVPATQCPKLEFALFPADRLEPGITQLRTAQFRWLRNDRISVPSPRRYCTAEILQYLVGNSGVLQS